MGYDRKQFACVIIKYLSVLIFLFNYGCSDINHNSREWEEYEIKVLRELSKAMGYFQKALSIAVETSDTANQVISLCNIATIYHLRSDTSGLIPAKEAYRLSKTIKNPHIIISSALTLSQMLLLAGKSEEAFEYMESITNSTNSRQFSEVELIKAQCLSASGNNTEAKS